MVILIIIKDLVEIASYYFASEIILKNLKKFITIVLYKKEKNNYFFLSSYKLITFKNMLVKALEKHVINIMSKAAEKYRLFL